MATSQRLIGVSDPILFPKLIDPQVLTHGINKNIEAFTTIYRT